MLFSKIFVLLGCITSLAFAAIQDDDRPLLSQMLAFEASAASGALRGWTCNPDLCAVLDDQVVHGGRHSAKIERTYGTSGPFSALSSALPLDFVGQQIEFHGFIRTENVDGYVGLVLREDNGTAVVDFASMQQTNPVRGTSGWGEYSVHLFVRPEATSLYFGVVFRGTGVAWVDD